MPHAGTIRPPGRPLATDLVDLVDDEDRPIGAVPKEDLGSQRAGFRTVHVLVTDRSGRLVLQRLSEQRARHPGRLGSSAAGYLFRGESYDDAARRITKLELGVTECPHFVTKVRMEDGGSTKFVGVYSASSDDVWNASPEQIASLERRAPADIDDAIAFEPADFTPTFRLAYFAWRGDSPA